MDNDLGTHNRRNEIRRLLAKRDELRERLTRILASHGAKLEADYSDQAIQLQNRDVYVELGREAVEQLALVEAALRRDKEGRYGVCIGCESFIPAARLDAVPWATHCVTCAESITPELS